MEKKNFDNMLSSWFSNDILSISLFHFKFNYVKQFQILKL